MKTLFIITVTIATVLLVAHTWAQDAQKIPTEPAERSLGFSFQVHPMIQQWVDKFRDKDKEVMEVGLYRSGMFMLMARRIFREEGVPENVAWLGQVTSAWKPGGPKGLWGFSPDTAKRFGLRTTILVDEKKSLDESTRAAARYLKFLANRYGGNWELAIAAYTSGETAIDNAIRRVGAANFWVAYPYVPAETREFVPTVLATILIANSPNNYGFGHVRPAPSLKYDRIRVPASTKISLLAKASDTTVEYLRFLNPHLKSAITPPEPYVVNVPVGKANEIVALFRRIPASKAGTTTINPLLGETWQSISNRTGVSMADLMAANPGMAVPKGKIFVPIPLVEKSTYTYVTPATSEKCYSETEIDLTVGQLAASFNGNDPVRVATEIERREKLVKDEFETTQQLQERLAKQKTQPIYGNLRLESTFAFLIPAEFKYDADVAEMRVESDLSNPMSLHRVRCDSDVSSLLVRDAGLNLVNEGVRTSNVWSTRFPVKLENARQLKPNLRVLAVVRLVEKNGSYIHRKEGRSLRLSYNSVLLNASLSELWIIDSSSGKIVTKHPIDFANLKRFSSINEKLIEDVERLSIAGSDDEVLSTLRKVLAEEPMCARCYAILGRTHLRRRDFDQAISSFKTAIFWDSSLIEPHLSLAKIYLEKGNCLLARNYLASALETDSKNSDVLALQRLVERCGR